MKRIIVIIFIILPIALYSQNIPKWYPDPYVVYNQKDYIAASAVGSTKKSAENNAIAELSRQFGLTITSDYEEEIVYSNDELNEYIKDSTKVIVSHDLINVRIASVVYNSNTREYYAIAIMEKISTIPIIEQRVQNNISELNKYLSLISQEEDLMRQYSILYKAATLSYKTEIYIEQLIVIGGENISLDDDIKSSSLYYKAMNVLNGITYGVSVQAENSLIQYAIEDTIANLGMNISSDPTYTFKEKLTYDGNDVMYGGKRMGMYMLNYSLILELFNSQGKYLTSFTFKGKEGGANEEDAKRVLRAKLARDVSESLEYQFSSYLKSLLN